MNQLKLLDFIQSNKNWEELLTQAPYNLKVSRDGPYILFKYSQIDSDFSLQEVKEARGIIFREDTWRPVCIPFFKFMNAEEPNSDLAKINWETASVQEKVDGSLMKVWYDDSKWHVSTNGTIDAYKADINCVKYKTFGELFEAALPITFNKFVDALNTDFTYMFELVSPYNRVVIPYEQTELYFLGARNNILETEVLPENTHLFDIGWFKTPTRYKLTSYEEVRKCADELLWDEEGYVCCDNQFNRVKIKSLKYLEAHYARNNSVMTYERLLEVVRAGEQAEFLIYASDFKDELDKVQKAYLQACVDLETMFNHLDPSLCESRKAYAEKVLAQPKWMQSFLFNKGKYSLLNMIHDTPTKKWVEYLEKGGYLDE